MNPNAAAFAAILKQRQEQGVQPQSLDINGIVHSVVGQTGQMKKNGKGVNGHGSTVSASPVSYHSTAVPFQAYSTQQYQQYAPPQPYFQPNPSFSVPYSTQYAHPPQMMTHSAVSHNPVQPALGPTGQPMYSQPPSTLAYAVPNYSYSSIPYSAAPNVMYSGYPPPQPPPPTTRPPVPSAPYQPVVYPASMVSSSSSSSSTSSTSHVFSQYKNSKNGGNGGGFQNKRNNSNSNQSGGSFGKKAAAEVYCDPCERIFSSQAQYDRHLPQHVPCSHPGCAFSASARAVERHTQVRHELFGSQGFKTIEVEGRQFSVLVGVRPEDVSKWREDRRKKFPSAENVALRQAGQKALQEAGGVNEQDNRPVRNKGGDKRKRGLDEAGGANSKDKKSRQEKSDEGRAAEGGPTRNKKEKKSKHTPGGGGGAEQQQQQQKPSKKGGLIVPPPLTGGARGTLLKKLLEDQILEEENILLQGIRYLVRHHPLFLAEEGKDVKGAEPLSTESVPGEKGAASDEQVLGNAGMEAGHSGADTSDEEEEQREQESDADENDDDNDDNNEEEGQEEEESYVYASPLRGDGAEGSPPPSRDCVSRSTVISLTGCSVDDYSACSVNTERAVTGSVSVMGGMDDLSSMCSKD